MAYLKVEKPRFLFLEGSTGAVAVAGVTTVTLPGASAVHAASSVDRPAVGASAPAPVACSSAASAALDEGVHAPTSQGGPPPVAFLLLFLSRRRVIRRRRGKESLLITQPEFLVPLVPALPPPDPPLLTRRPLLLPPLRRACARSGSGHGWVGPRGVHGHPLLGRMKCQSRGDTWQKNKGKGEEPTHWRGVGEHNERPKVVVAMPDGLEADGTPRSRGRVLPGEAVVYLKVHLGP
jgi:hypothetical protein